MPAEVTARAGIASGAHAVERLVFEIGFGSEEAALAGHGWLETFIRREALPLIEQVFDEAAPEAGVLSIDGLEIDLGACGGPGDERVLANRLRERLRMALGDAGAMARQRQAGAAHVPAADAEWRQVLQYLHTGRLQWNDTTAIDTVAQRVARRDGAALDAQLLQAGPQGEAMRRRWVEQLGVDRLPELARAWVVLEQVMTGAAPGAWREAWRMLFSRRPANLRELLRRLGRSARARRRLLAALSPGQRGELVALLAGPQRAALEALVAEAARRRSGRSSALWECMLAHLCLEPAGAPLPEAGLLAAWADETEGRSEPARLQLEAALAAGEAEGLSAAWRVLWRGDRATLRRLVRRQGTRGALRGLLGAQAPVGLRQQALELLAPGEGEAIGAFMAQACAWHARTHASAQDGFDDWLWQQATALLLAPGAAPSAATCIAVLLRKLAERQRIEVEVAALALRSGMQAASPGQVASQQVLQILQALQGFGAGRAVPQDVPASRQALAPAGVGQRIAALCARLKQQAPLSIDESRHWEAEARVLLAQHREALQPALRATLGLPQAASRLTALLPGEMLADVLQLLRPRDHERARHCVRLVAQACDGVDAAARRRIEPLGWQFLMRELVEEGRRFVASAFSGRLLDFLADKLRWTGRAGWRDTVRRAVDRVAGSAGEPLAREVAAGLAERHAPEPARAGAADTAVVDATGITVSNAGLVLAGPYLERLFALLGLLKDHAFIDDGAQQRALHLLHFLATGADEAPESTLVLPKLLCGMEAARPAARRIALLPREREAAEGLLGAMISHWKVLGRTSVAGLRETFLRREGLLVRDDEHWRLEVAPGPFDMLLDTLPWGYGTVKLPWMPEVLHVQWR